MGGRLFESFRTKAGDEKVIETGRVEVWEPPKRLVLTWRNANSGPSEVTEVVVELVPRGQGRTLLTLTHRGWDHIRPDHPARQGQPTGPFLAELGRWWADLLGSLRTRALELEER